MTLADIITTQSIAERNRALKRAFAPDSNGVEVVGKEQEALVVLLNLSLRKEEVDDLCDLALATTTLRNQKHLQLCCSEIQWLHSHNLKFPNARVSHQRLLTSPQAPVSGTLSSANFPARYGWSHDSARIRKASLFCAEFKWNGLWTCLAKELNERDHIWQKVFFELGFSRRDFQALTAMVGELLGEETFPLEVSPFSSQIRVPFKNSYCSVTPVVSHSLQSAIQNLDYTLKKGKFKRLQHEHSASIGNLCAAHGGRVSSLFYPPHIVKYQHATLSSSLEKRCKSDSVFNRKAINNKIFHNALRALINPSVEITLKKRRQRRLSALRYVRKELAAWLAPVMEWRDSLEETEGTLYELEQDSLVYRLLTFEPCDFPVLLNQLNICLHEELQTSFYGAEFAFHPRLIHPLKSQLLWLLNYFGKDDDESDVESDVQYIHFSSLRVFDVDAMANPYLCGIPSLTAVWGMCHRFQLQLNKLLPEPVSVDGFTWFVHQYSLSAGRKLPEPSRYIRNELKRPGFIAGQHCDLTIDLILKISAREDFRLSDDDIPLIQASLPAKLAGGSVHPPSLYERREWCSLYSIQHELFDRLARLPAGGRWIFPTHQEVHSLEELMDIITSDYSIRPAMLGYLLLEEPTLREGALTSMHAYAEPVLGLVQALSAIDVRIMKPKVFWATAFWQLKVSERAMLMKSL